eukprot:scaffold107935_cov28-Tisochrysis_lutea.AAC.1
MAGPLLTLRRTSPYKSACSVVHISFEPPTPHDHWPRQVFATVLTRAASRPQCRASRAHRQANRGNGGRWPPRFLHLG